MISAYAVQRKLQGKSGVALLSRTWRKKIYRARNWSDGPRVTKAEASKVIDRLIPECYFDSRFKQRKPSSSICSVRLILEVVLNGREPKPRPLRRGFTLWAP